jgi:hypothetical protein
MITSRAEFFNVWRRIVLVKQPISRKIQQSVFVLGTVKSIIACLVFDNEVKNVNLMLKIANKEINISS